MRRCQAVVLALAAGFLGGCSGAHSESLTTRFAAPGPLSGPSGADVVQLDLFLIERAAGDDFLNRKLWELVDEQAVSMEGKTALEDDGFRIRQNLEDNGFRVGQIGGLPPSGLQALLASPLACPDPRHVFLHKGHVLPVPLGPAMPLCRLQVYQDGRPTTMQFKDAQCRLEIVPQLTGDGRVRLQFTPYVQFGSRALSWVVRKDSSGVRRWDRQEEQPGEAITQASWEITVASNEYIVIGTHLKRSGTLGQACFLSGLEEDRAVQRLLVIRTNRTLTEPEPADVRLDSATPVALRAGLMPFAANHD
jgi:hypothetical protein